MHREIGGMRNSWYLPAPRFINRNRFQEFQCDSYTELTRVSYNDQVAHYNAFERFVQSNLQQREMEFFSLPFAQQVNRYWVEIHKQQSQLFHSHQSQLQIDEEGLHILNLVRQAGEALSTVNDAGYTVLLGDDNLGRENIVKEAVSRLQIPGCTPFAAFEILKNLIHLAIKSDPQIYNAVLTVCANTLRGAITKDYALKICVFANHLLKVMEQLQIPLDPRNISAPISFCARALKYPMTNGDAASIFDCANGVLSLMARSTPPISLDPTNYHDLISLSMDAFKYARTKKEYMKISNFVRVSLSLMVQSTPPILLNQRDCFAALSLCESILKYSTAKEDRGNIFEFMQQLLSMMSQFPIPLDVATCGLGITVCVEALKRATTKEEASMAFSSAWKLLNMMLKFQIPLDRISHAAAISLCQNVLRYSRSKGDAAQIYSFMSLLLDHYQTPLDQAICNLTISICTDALKYRDGLNIVEINNIESRIKSILTIMTKNQIMPDFITYNEILRFGIINNNRILVECVIFNMLDNDIPILVEIEPQLPNYVIVHGNNSRLPEESLVMNLSTGNEVSCRKWQYPFLKSAEHMLARPACWNNIITLSIK